MVRMDASGVFYMEDDEVPKIGKDREGEVDQFSLNGKF